MTSSNFLFGITRPTNITLVHSSSNSAASTGIQVTGNLTSIGSGSAQAFFDDGTNGDVTANDNVWSWLATVSADTTPGSKSIATQVVDAQGRNATANIALDVSHHAYLLETGRIVLQGTAEELLANRDVQRAYLGSDLDAENRAWP